jgi:hypothetical protein
MPSQIYDIAPGFNGQKIAQILLTPGQTQITLNDVQAWSDLQQGNIVPTGTVVTPPEPDPVNNTDLVQLRRGPTRFEASVSDLAAEIGSLSSSGVQFRIQSGVFQAKATSSSTWTTLAVLDGSGKLPDASLPPLAIGSTFVVASQSAMLALTAEIGDMAVRSDENKSYRLAAIPASTLASWVEIKSPTAAVASVAGRTGAVTLTAADVGLGSVINADTTNAANITSGTLPAARLDAGVARLDQLNDFGDNIIRAARAQVNTYTANRTLGTSDRGAIVRMDAASAVTVTLPATWSPGASVVVRQAGLGQITFAPAGGTSATLINIDGHTKTEKQHAQITLTVVANVGGSAAVWALDGRTGL